MRQTNNAINLLNASYQAVFKHAYVTGLATSVALLSATPYAVAATTGSFANDIKDASATDFVYEKAQAGAPTRNTTGYANSITITGKTGNKGANADVGLNITSKTDSRTDIYFTDKLNVTNAFLNISGSDTCGATLTGRVYTSLPISGSLEFNGSKLNISHGKILVNTAEFVDSAVDISGSVGGNKTKTQDLFINYSTLRTGLIEANSDYQGQAGETTFSNTDVNLGDFSALDAMGDITFERGTITIKAAKDTNGTNKTIGEIAAKAIIRADEFNLNTSGTLHVGNNPDGEEAAGAVYAETTNLNTGSKLEIASGATLQLAGQISQQKTDLTAVPEGTNTENAINTTIGAGKLNIQSTVNNSGDLILGANSVSVNDAKTLDHYSSSQYDVTQSAGTVNNHGTLALGEVINEDDTTPLDASKGTTYTLKNGVINNFAGAEIQLNNGSKLDLQGGTFVNAGKVVLNSGSTLSAAAAAVNNKQSTYSVTRGENVFVADVNNLSKLDNLDHQAGSAIELKNGVFKANLDTANSLGAAIAKGLSSGTAIDSGSWRINNATLQLSNNLDLTSYKLATTGLTATSGSTLATTGDLSFTTASDHSVGNLAGFDKLQGANVTIKQVPSDSNQYLWLNTVNGQSKTITATKSLTTDGKALSIGKDITVELGTNEFQNGITNISQANLRTPESHHVDVDLQVASGGIFKVTADPWTAQNITTVSGSELNVLGSAFNSLNNEFKTHAALTANNLNLDGIVNVSAGADLTSLGDMTFGTHANAQVSDSSLNTQNLNLSGSANLTNSTANATQTIAVNSNSGSLTAYNSKVSAQNFTLSNGAEITFHNNSTLTVHDTLKTAQNAGANNINLDNSDLTAEHILLNTESNLHASNGSQITTNTLKTTNTGDKVQVDLSGSNLTIKGDGDDAQADLNVKLSMNGGTLNLGDALDTIGLRYQQNDSNFKVDDNFIKIIANSTRVQLDLTNSGLGSLDSNLKQQLYEQLFDSNGPADAYLSLTGVTDSDVTTTKDDAGNIIADFDNISKDENGNIVMDGDAENTREAILTGVDTSKKISGGWRAIQTANDSKKPVQVDASKQLNIYGATTGGNLVENSAHEAVGVYLDTDATLTLDSSGNIGDITGDGEVNVGQGQTVNVVASTADSKTSQLTAQQLDNYGNLNVDTVNANILRLQSSSNLQATDVTTSQLIAAAGAQVKANNLSTDSANLNQANIQAQNFKASKNVLAYGATQITVTDTLELQKGLNLYGDASVTTQNLNLVGGDLNIGIDSTAGKSGSSATLVANTVDLNGNSLILDPEFGQKTATAFIKTFADLSEINKAADGSTPAPSTTTDSTATPMQLNGNLIVGRNSALGIGGEQSEFTAALTKLQDANGSLQPTGTFGKDGTQGVGALLYINTDNLALNGNKLVVGSEDLDTLKQIASGSDTIYLGNNAGLQISTKALSAAKTNDTQIFADLDSNDTIKASGGMLILPSTATSQDLGQIFGEQLNLAEGTTIDVQSENGAYKGTIDSADDLHGLGDFAMTQTENTRQILNQMSNPTFAFYEQVRQQVMGTKTANAQMASVQDANVQTVEGGEADSNLVALIDDADTSNNVDTSSTTPNAGQNDETTVQGAQGATQTAQNTQSTPNTATNFILTAGEESSGLPLEQAARLGTLGVGVQIAQQVSQTASDAILQRVGMSQTRNSNSGMTVLDNAKSAAWISPIYQDFSADDFSADNLKYGADIDMYGFAAGFDHTFNNGLRIGAMLNVGGGDADGSGIATGISNDFSYYGAGLYASLQPMRDLTLSADVSYTMVDNDLEASTGLKEYGKLSGSVDSTALSAGLNAQYKFNAGGLYITPHAGLRYTRLDLDGYDVKLDGEQLAHADSDSVNVFSIPVGVGLSTTLTNGDWIIQPQADFTVTANFGDDEIKSRTTFDGQTSAINYNTEFVDSITYGAKAGVQVQNGNFSFGANVGYTKSSNTDELGVGLNARFVF